MAFSMQRTVIIAVTGSLFLSVTAVSADSYRWKDKEGETHYGAAVPPEYADQPYDVLNDAGLVTGHIKVTREPQQVNVEPMDEEQAPDISEEEQRQRKSDRLLVIKYRSEQDIQDALNLKITQLGYESKIIQQSFDSTAAAIRDQIRLAADEQRAGIQVNADQQQRLDKLYLRLTRDENRISALDERERSIRTRFKADLDHYRRLQTTDQG